MQILALIIFIRDIESFSANEILNNVKINKIY